MCAFEIFGAFPTNQEAHTPVAWFKEGGRRVRKTKTPFFSQASFCVIKVEKGNVPCSPWGSSIRFVFTPFVERPQEALLSLHMAIVMSVGVG